jgi:hypothetical protein
MSQNLMFKISFEQIIEKAAEIASSDSANVSVSIKSKWPFPVVELYAFQLW